jgi:chromosome segregation ATPase
MPLKGPQPPTIFGLSLADTLQDQLAKVNTMSTMIAQEVPLGRKARRQRLAFQRVVELSGEIATLQSKLSLSEESLRHRESEARSIQNDLTDQLEKLQRHVSELEEMFSSRELELNRLNSNMSFLKEEIDEARDQKERLRAENDRLKAELKLIKVDRAKDEIEEWRAIGHKPPWKRCYERIEGLFKKDSADRRHDGFNDLLRLPPP